MIEIEIKSADSPTLNNIHALSRAIVDVVTGQNEAKQSQNFSRIYIDLPHKKRRLNGREYLLQLGAIWPKRYALDESNFKYQTPAAYIDLSTYRLEARIQYRMLPNLNQICVLEPGKNALLMKPEDRLLATCEYLLNEYQSEDQPTVIERFLAVVRKLYS